MSSEPQSLSEVINGYLDIVSTALYSYILIALLIGTGLYFFIRSKALPLRMFRESIRVVAAL